MTGRGARGAHRAATVVLLSLSALVIASCTGGDHQSDSSDGSAATIPPPTAADLALSGGDSTVHNTGSNAFAQFVPGLTSDERHAFVVGNNFFNDNWVTAPASTTGRDGLGPLFNAQSCSSCHFKDGRGQPPTPEKPNALGLLIRLSVPGTDEHGGPKPDVLYGGQLQDKGINRVPAEGVITITETELHGTYADGTPYTLIKPNYSITEPAYGPLPEDLMISPRVAPPVFGTGLLEAIPTEDILARADEIGRAHV